MGSDRQTLMNLEHGRVSAGSIYECYHGKHAISLLVLEWQPFERILLQSSLPLPWVTMLVGFYLTPAQRGPTQRGTCLKYMYTKGKGPLPNRLIADWMLRTSHRDDRDSLEKFKNYMEETHASRTEEVDLTAQPEERK